jgi:hypothetical protein
LKTISVFRGWWSFFCKKIRVLPDANVLISVLNKEYPLYIYEARILHSSDRPGFNVFTSPVRLAIAFNFAEKKTRRMQREK